LLNSKDLVGRASLVRISDSCCSWLKLRRRHRNSIFLQPLLPMWPMHMPCYKLCVGWRGL